MNAVFLRPDAAADPAQALRKGTTAGRVERFDLSPGEFRAIPSSPFAYWFSAVLRGLYSRFPTMAQVRGRVEQGASTKDVFRFLRCWWETRQATAGATNDKIWWPYAKGGDFTRYYGELWLLVRWAHEARQLEAAVLAKYPYLGTNADWLLHRESHYGAPGITWSGRSQIGASFRTLPQESVFSDPGPAINFDGDGIHILGRLGLCNSSIYSALADLQAGFGRFTIGVIQRTPIPGLTPEDERALSTLAHRAWSLKRNLDTRTETSHAFTLPALLQVEGENLSARTLAWNNHAAATNAEIDEIQAEIDDRCFELYGIGEDDRRAITEGFGAGEEEHDSEQTDSEPNEEDDQSESDADQATLAAELVSWAVGVAFGRFDVRLSTGECELPKEPDPFDPLPVCSAAMLTGVGGLPLDAAPEGYSLRFPEDGILVDDEGDPRDLLAAIRAVFDEVFGADTDAWWSEVAAVLDPKSHDVRPWLASSFFTHHLKRHSKSRRKAPIVWQLAVPSKRYSVFLYAHRLTADSLFQVQNDVVAPKLAHEERRLTNLIQDAAGNPSASQRKEIAAQEILVEELRAMFDEVDRVASLWNPDLDDGVVLTMAPLWRTVPQHKAWQRELKRKWKELSGGKYDWAHLAMHLWPERVVPKCAADRSLAIAHDLEDVFWVEDEDGKWQQRDAPTEATAELIAERRSAAVAEAVGGLG